ncbi:Lovastatin diketide synthase LovF [Daldinia childiae]|uniref:Lovastatin diketide synthase LovF n=1 Tax=Daldinia childiae TaxID=326645 RepID=UPI001447FB96|nr:Lovastatin diketide synthase LovF [Daldinia childiae]KAF3064509.1 Lovastatin diketide synthase LovF [Daldinia childiae]
MSRIARIEAPQLDNGAQINALEKSGSHPTWGIDVENSADAVQELLRKVCYDGLQTKYSDIRELEWAAYVICKKVVQQFSATDVEKMALHHQMYYHYARRQCELAEEGDLPCQSPEWILANESTEKRVLARIAKASLEGEILLRINDNICGILEGKVQVSDVINLDDLPRNIYRTGISYKQAVAVQCQYIKHLSHKRPLRILEIGAGTTSITSSILSGLGHDAMSRLQKYTYTDASDAFFPEANENLKEWSPMMEYKVLDIEKDPLEQNIEGESYDLVVSFQVLHTTSSITAALTNSKKLLKPGGHLIVTDLTNKIARRSVVFGTLPTWWLGENDGRNWGPELSEREWDLRLRSLGYLGVEWCFRDQQNAGYSSSIMASSIPYITGNKFPGKAVIITSPTENSQTKSMIKQLSDQLVKNGVSIEKMTLIGVKTLDLSATQCIVSCEVERPCLSSLGNEEFDAIKRIALHSEGVLWLTKGGSFTDVRVPELNMVVGLAQTIRFEAPEVRFTTLDLDPDVPCGQSDVTDTILQLLRIQREQPNGDTYFVKRNGALYVSRFFPDEALSRILATEEFQENPTELTGLQLRPNATYIIPGGMGGLGRPLIMWMAKNGARNIVTTSRSGAKDPRAQKLLQELSIMGVRVKVFAADVGYAEQCQDVLNDLSKEKFPPVRGVVIMSMALQAEMFEDMGFDAWSVTLQSKYNVTFNMHHMLPDDLDFFICVSAGGGLIGLVLHSNYNAGCNYQDAMAYYRRAQGLKATSIDLGWVDDVGYAAENMKVPELLRTGLRKLTVNQFIAVVGAAIADQVGIQPAIGLLSGGSIKANGDEHPYWFSDTRFGPLSVYGTQAQIPFNSDNREKERAATNLERMIRAATSLNDVKGIVCSALIVKLAKNLTMDPEDINSNQSIQAYEADDFVAFELRNWALREFQSLIPIPEILKDVPLLELAGVIASKSKLITKALRDSSSV